MKRRGGLLITSTSKLREKILKQRKADFKKHSRKLVTYDDLPAPYPKTKLMRYIELKFGERLENIIFGGTIYELEKTLGIDATTISKWRKIVSEAREREFWSQFEQH